MDNHGREWETKTNEQLVRFAAQVRAADAKFSFGTNNFDDRPKDLTHWLDVITWLDLHSTGIWTPQDLKYRFEQIRGIRFLRGLWKAEGLPSV